MSRQRKSADERQRGKRLRKICLAAGEGVSKAVAFSFALASREFDCMLTIDVVNHQFAAIVVFRRAEK